MTNESATFGTPEHFHLCINWLSDAEAVARRPKDHGWSMGALSLAVAGTNLTSHRVGEQTQDQLVWYVGPLLHWLAENWVVLFHEERFQWPERSEDAAAEVCNRAISRFARVGPAMADALGGGEAWYHRHGLASAAAGGLFPDIFIRRFLDDVEVSWTAIPPPFAPNGFVFETEAGFARMAIADVAEPLWNLLDWVRSNPPNLETPEFRADWEVLTRKVDALDHLTPESFNAVAVAEKLLQRVRAAFHARGRDDLLKPDLDPGGHYAKAEAPGVAMFGGLSVDLSDFDIATLRDALIVATDGEPTEPLRSLIEDAPLRGKPWQDGYDLAEDLLDRLDEIGVALIADGFVDVRALCQSLGIGLNEKQFDTDTIRGVALAGAALAPSIIVNTRSAYNHNNDGRRFTTAHELCHILHDQSRARRLAHASGPWVAPGIEKRANAFAAWLLMPPRLLQQYLKSGLQINADRLRMVAGEMRVADSALVEHLFNLDLIDEAQREELRLELQN